MGSVPLKPYQFIAQNVIAQNGSVQNKATRLIEEWSKVLVAPDSDFVMIVLQGREAQDED